MLLLILYVTFFDKRKFLKLSLSLACSLYFGVRTNLVFISEKCPDCYGNDLCQFFQNRQIQLTWFSHFLSVFNSKWTKSVFHGVFNDSRVVIKRKSERNFKKYEDVSLNNDEALEIVLCPSVSNKFFLYDHIKNLVGKQKRWLEINTSIEPLLLMYFQSIGNWPFPKYLGACGDFIVQEYKGEPLTNFLLSEFSKRIELAINLLEMANVFTLGHSELGFYFTDYSLENLVVDTTGKIFLIDLDSVIISNRSAFKENHLKESIHSSEILHENKYAFSPSDICSHYISDHNYFSICKFMLLHPEDGLLKVVPESIKMKKELLYLLKECAQPSHMADRFFAAHRLQNLLKEISKDKPLNS